MQDKLHAGQYIRAPMKREKNSPFYLAIATEKASLEVTLHSSSNHSG
jgi:hypothetical protein